MICITRMVLLLLLLSLCISITGVQAETSGKFVHPGLLHSGDSLEAIRLKIAVGEEPWKTAFEQFRKDSCSSYDYRMRGPYKSVSRLPHSNSNNADTDFRAAYFNALMFSFTADQLHAEKAKEILNAYAREFQGYSKDDRDRQLTASLGPFLLLNAAEIIRHSETAGWNEKDVEAFEKYLKTKVLPEIIGFADFANGNWDTACIKTVVAVGVFCDDRETFEIGIEYYRNGKGNGRLTHYIINESGQSQESGRDQQHTQLGLGHLAEAAEIAYRQGGDLYGLHENRLLAGFEYTAKYNLGEDVPFVSHLDTTGKYRHDRISEQGRGRIRPIHEMVWNHYGRRAKLDAPYTKRAAEKMRPEGPAFNADHPGYGTLLFSVP